MYRVVSKPGPSPSSCLTCRQRRKKCDKARPCCKRCLKGGYECLGYENSQSRVSIRQNYPSAPTTSRLQPGAALVPIDRVGSKILNTPPLGLSEECGNPTGTKTELLVRPSALGAAMPYKTDSLTSDINGAEYSTEEFDRLWPQDQTQPAICSRRRVRSRPFPVRDAGSIPEGEHSMDATEHYYHSVPPSIDVTQIMRESFSVRVANGYIIQQLELWFLPPPPIVCRTITNWLSGSTKTSRVMVIGMNFLQAFRQGPREPTIIGYMEYLDKFGSALSTNSRVSSSLNDMSDRLMALIEIVAIKLDFLGAVPGYTLLRKALSMFLLLVSSDSDLLVERPSGNLAVSFFHTLNAPRHELMRFVLYDVVSAFLLGVPPLAEYGHGGECDSEKHEIEWMYGISAELLYIISQINSWRAGSRFAIDDWQTLESRVLAWKPQHAPLDVPDPSATERGSLERAAVQEGWRHVLLIYIYMGICGASSHDSRVQESVGRIFALGETVKDSRIGLHMLPHCVVAGLASRLEKHRIAVYKKLNNVKSGKAWIFTGSQFCLTLYHLWHGVGAGGAVVTWDDYVWSRCATFHV